MSTEQTIQIAQFNPQIKKYILLVGAIFLTIIVIGIPLAIIWLLGVGQYFSRRYYESLECQLSENKPLCRIQ